MKSSIVKIELISEIGTLVFLNIDALSDFETNNWRTLGETSYNVVREYQDGVVAGTLHTGINASFYLIQDIEDED